MRFKVTELMKAITARVFDNAGIDIDKALKITVELRPTEYYVHVLLEGGKDSRALAYIYERTTIIAVTTHKANKEIGTGIASVFNYLEDKVGVLERFNKIIIHRQGKKYQADIFIASP